MTGYVDLHVHYVPGVDDGARTDDEALAVCQELGALGYGQLVATPHMRLGMFENKRAGLEAAFNRFVELARERGIVPLLGLGSEQHCDASLLDELGRGGLLPYPGGRAILVEFAYESFPVAVEQLLFKLAVKRLRPVLAHPERYVPLYKRTDPIDRLLDQDVAMQLDLLSLVGKYGRASQRAAERMLEEGVYTVAGSDVHGTADLAPLARALGRLSELVGKEEAELLLADNPRRLLQGEVTQ
jgi:protein-tyrosine phosphatase